MAYVATTFSGIWSLHQLENAAKAHNRVIVVASGGGQIKNAAAGVVAAFFVY